MGLFFWRGLKKKITTDLTFLGIILSLSLMIPFIKVSISTSPPGESLRESRYLKYLLFANCSLSSTEVKDSRSMLESNKKL